MKLTNHVSLEELVASDTAARMGIDNTPSERVRGNLTTTASLLEDIRAALSVEAGHDVPLHITSGHRCEALEKVVTVKDFASWCARRGYSPDSLASWQMYFSNKAHPDGRAADFSAPRFGTPYQIVQSIAKQPALMERIDQIIMEGTWVHVAWRDNPRHEVKTATFKNGVPQYSMGLS